MMTKKYDPLELLSRLALAGAIQMVFYLDDQSSHP
jgi:hypothetical protein